MSATDSTPVAIVTGASRGIGRATATEFAQRGYRIVVVARSDKDLQETVRLCGISDAAAMIVAADLTEPETADRIVSGVMKQFVRIDVLVNNAGVAPLLSIADTTPEVWRDTIETNLSAAFYLSRACWPIFEEQRGGAVINVSSLAARDPFAGFFAYGAAKAGLNTLSLALSRDGAPNNIRVYALALGATETGMFRGLPGMAEYPREQTLDPADVATMIADLADNKTSHASGDVIELVKR